MFKRIITATLLSLSATSNAAIEYSKFEDINGNDVTPKFTLEKTSIINNSTEVQLLISAGLDRRVQVILETLNGQALSETTSSVININDKLTLKDGSAFYGKELYVPIESDGQYNIVVNTISLNGEIVNNERYRVNRDTAAPTAGEITKYIYGGTTNKFTPEDVWHTGYWYTNYYQINNVEDADSDITSVSIVSYVLENNEVVEHKVRALDFDYEQKLARFTFKDDYSLWPTNDNAETLFGFNFRITDTAGNVLNTPVQPMYYDTVKTKNLELIGVREPGSSNSIAGKTGYVPYTSGFTVKENPISVMYRIPKTEHIDYVRGGYGPVGHAEQITDFDEHYVYVIFNRTFGFKDSNYVRFRDQREWVSSYFGYNLNLSPSAPKSPKRIGSAEYLYSDRGWGTWNRWHIQVEELPLQIRGSRQRVEPRSYPQRWSHDGASCIIPAGDDICEAIYDTPKVLSLGDSHYFHGGSSLNSEDNTLVGPPGWANVSYNGQYAPEITAVSLSGAMLVASINQPMAGSWFDQLRLRGVWLEDNGEKLPITATLKRNGGNYEAQWDLSQLPENEYIITVFSEEMHGLQTQSNATYQFSNDKTAPVLSIRYDNEETVPDTINELRDLKITITDNVTEVFMDELILRSIDGEINVSLGYSLLNQSDDGKEKLYSPELPRLFPSLDESKRYVMQARARDRFGNESTIIQNFSFIPSNLIVMDTQDTLPVSEFLKDANNQAITFIYSNHDLVLEDGRNATGIQTAIVTVNDLATYAIKVGNEIIHPGQSKQVDIDLGEAGGKLNVPIVPLADNLNGQVEVMFEIPSLSSKYDQ